MGDASFYIFIIVMTILTAGSPDLVDTISAKTNGKCICTNEKQCKDKLKPLSETKEEERYEYD